jgi:hypothetical protein
MSVITEAPKDKPVDPRSELFTWAWLQWFQSVFLTASTTQESGPTANRPTSNLWVGRRYFDTTVGKPVYLKSTGPNVWVDGAGTVS